MGIGDFGAATNGDITMEFEGFHHHQHECDTLQKTLKVNIIVITNAVLMFFAHADFKRQTWWCSQKLKAMWICPNNFSWLSGGVEKPVGSCMFEVKYWYNEDFGIVYYETHQSSCV